MTRRKVLVPDPIPVDKLGLGKEFEIDYCPNATRDEFLQKVGDCEVLIVRSRTKVDAEAIAMGRRLKIIARPGTGLDNIDLGAAGARGIEVVNTPESLVEAVSEHIFAMMLALARNLPEANSSTRGGAWEKERFIGVELSGKTLGIVGLGRIGRRVGEIAHVFGMSVLGYDVVEIDRELVDRIGGRMVDLDSLFSSSDFVTLHVPLSPETKHMVDLRRVSRMKKTSFLINASRGAVIDELDLGKALKERTIAGAALDVFEREPPGREILSSPNLIVTPHIGGQTLEGQQMAVSAVGQKIKQFFEKHT
jgi:D-3-phosphoglycerate dehydrogenase